MVINMDLDRLYKNFEVLEDWQARYAFIIDMGKKIPLVDPAAKTEENRVHGCMSTVHMTIKEKDGDIEFLAESDAMIVNGLIAVMHIIYDGKTAEEIAAVDIKEIFKALGLEGHISPNRRNGFFSMVERLQNLANN